MEDTGAALLDKARHGDRAALEALLERHQDQIYRFSMKMCHDPEDAKDVLQDTLLAMARGVRDFRGASSVSTWLYTIARSYCIKKRRRSKYAPTSELSMDAPEFSETTALRSETANAEDHAASKEVEDALESAVVALDPMYREVLVLRDVEGLTAPEVAEVLGVSVQAVKSRLHRARQAVRDHVAPILGVPLASQGAATGTCPDVLTMFSQHLEDEISADTCAAMERHLAGCARCRGVCDSLKQTLALCRSSGATVKVPTAVQASVRVALRDFISESP